MDPTGFLQRPRYLVAYGLAAAVLMLAAPAAVAQAPGGAGSEPAAAPPSAPPPTADPAADPDKKPAKSKTRKAKRGQGTSEQQAIRRAKQYLPPEYHHYLDRSGGGSGGYGR